MAEMVERVALAIDAAVAAWQPGDEISIKTKAAIAAIEAMREPTDARPNPVGEDWKHGDPPPHWSPERPHERHPQTPEEWNPPKDPVGTRQERAIRRLNFACDRDDPRAPAETAIVSRWDLSALLADLTHKRVYFEIHRRRAASTVVDGEPVAWAILADNGNIRMWSTINADVVSFAKQIGATVTPLYASPPDREAGTPVPGPHGEGGK